MFDEKNEFHNRQMHISKRFLLGHDEPIKDPINDLIKLDEREHQIVDLLREEPTLARSGMAERLV